MGLVNEQPQTSPAPVDEQQRVIIVTGLSGAGRRTAAHELEDLGWYVIDNLPPSMLEDLVELGRRDSIRRIAVVLDVRSRQLFEELPAIFQRIQAQGVRVDVLYIEASDEVIVKRQESARRPLPLQDDGRIMDGITRERRQLAGLRAGADMVIDTSNLNVHQLQDRVAHAFGDESAKALRVAVMSFGFKHGLPIDADMVFDVRFLPNPHWVPELRPQTGLSSAVADYVMSQPGAPRFLDQLEALFGTVAEGYLVEGKRLATIAIGCTGGKHRSTAMAEAFAGRLKAQGYAVKVIHRDLGLE